MRINRKKAAKPLAWMKRGYTIVYHPGEQNHCPSCGKRHWFVGRTNAECAFCATALPLENVSTYSASPRISRTGDGVWMDVA